MLRSTAVVIDASPTGWCITRKIAFVTGAIYVYEAPFVRHQVISKLTGVACSGQVDILALTICHAVAVISLVHPVGCVEKSPSNVKQAHFKLTSIAGAVGPGERTEVV